MQRSARSMRWLLPALALVLLPAIAHCETPSAAPQPERHDVVLLVHGLTFGGPNPEQIWGRPLADGSGWSGLIGHLDGQGHRFGGTLRPDNGELKLPRDLDREGVHGNSKRAEVFSLVFSPAAQDDGLSLKALEIAKSVAQLRRYTRSGKVQVVAFSAGGVAARVWLQGALPGVPYRGEVSRLITIAAPHLGSDLAHHLGDLLGTRATSLDYDGALIRELNTTRPLPTDVQFASIVIRGVAADARGFSSAYDPLLDEDFLEQLPADFRQGGDQVVHVRSQNLALAKTARAYEAETGRPVQFFAVRIADPTPGMCILTDDCPLRGTLVHSAAASDLAVLEMITTLVDDDGSLWNGLDDAQREAWAVRRAKQCAESSIEEAGFISHPLCEVDRIELESCNLSEVSGEQYCFEFAGNAHSLRPLLRNVSHNTHAVGKVMLTVDRFGRVLACQTELTEGDKWATCRDMASRTATLASLWYDDIAAWCSDW